jgi:glycerate-2-kinase
MLINNFDQLAVTPQRKTLLEIVEAGLESLQPEVNFKKTVRFENNILSILDQTYDLANYDHVYLIGFGKGSSTNAKLIEELLGEKLSEGYVIDTEEKEFKKIRFTLGTHPVVSQQNVDFTFKLMDRFSKMTERDLVLVVVCGGGSAMLEHPHSVSIEQKIEIEKALLKSGANIIEMNKIRQHLSDVKGGGLAQILYPATVATLIYSDVPGNDISYIASGPTVKDNTTIEDAMALVKKFNIPNITPEVFINNPSDDKYFEKVQNHIVLSNLTALNRMKEVAEQNGLNATIFSDKFQGEAREASLELMGKQEGPGILFAGGETTVTAKGEGKGGRNQEATLSALLHITDNSMVCFFASDGWDNSEAAGAIADSETKRKAQDANVDLAQFLENNDSYTAFQQTKDAIMTGRLPSNVADLMIVWKWDEVPQN